MALIDAAAGDSAGLEFGSRLILDLTLTKGNL